MQIRKLLIAAVLLVALSGAVWYARRHPESSETSKAAAASPTLVNVPETAAQTIDIKKKDGSTVALARQSGKWAITAPAAYAADQDAANSLVSSLGPATADSVVEEKPSDLGKYGLNTPSLTVTVHQKDGKSNEILFGDDVPAGSLVYARVNGDPKVYAVSSSVKTSLDKSVNDLRDKRLLTFDTNQLTRIDLASAKSDIEFGKNGQNDWAIVKPQPYRADNFQVEELLRKLTDAKMDLSSSAEDTKKTDASFASAKPLATAKLTDLSGTQSLEVRQNKDDYYAKSTAVAGTFKISSDLGKELEKPLDDFRNKKIFDFGFNDPTKLEIQQGSSDKTFVRSGSDWKFNGKVMDAGSVQSLIDKLRDLSAGKFATTGFTTVADTVTVVSNDGKRTEKAEFAKIPEGYMARRVNEPALYQLDAKAVNDILEASANVKPAASAKK
ncbi:MAG TPA: DUF4340 domain-containing protein [Bryobacteraceae bacterium]|jgi:hypothetical protein